MLFDAFVDALIFALEQTKLSILSLEIISYNIYIKT